MSNGLPNCFTLPTENNFTMLHNYHHHDDIKNAVVLLLLLSLQ
jgi:hypothetical protein